MTMNPEDLHDRTWLQLRECTLVAAAALKQIGDGEGQAPWRARQALEKIDHILSEDWEGPAE
jgi:hypothetical protein